MTPTNLPPVSIERMVQAVEKSAAIGSIER